MGRLNPETEIAEVGENNPKLIWLLPTTILYLFVNIPRIFANGFVLSVTPKVAFGLLIIELLISLMMSHFLIRILTDNELVPGGLLRAITNAMCPTAPYGKIWLINLLSILYTIIKLIVVYVVVTYYPSFLIDVCRDPDLFRCFTEDDLSNNATCQLYPSNHYKSRFLFSNSSQYLYKSPRACQDNESKNQVLMTTIIGLIASLILIAFPAGIAISKITRKENIQRIDDQVEKIHRLLFSCCRKEQSSNDTSKPANQSKKRSGMLGLKHVKFDEERIENPSIVFKDIRRVFAFPVKNNEQGQYF